MRFKSTQRPVNVVQKRNSQNNTTNPSVAASHEYMWGDNKYKRKNNVMHTNEDLDEFIDFKK